MTEDGPGAITCLLSDKPDLNAPAPDVWNQWTSVPSGLHTRRL